MSPSSLRNATGSTLLHPALDTVSSSSSSSVTPNRTYALRDNIESSAMENITSNNQEGYSNVGMDDASPTPEALSAERERVYLERIRELESELATLRSPQ